MSTVPTQGGRSHAGRKRLRSLVLALAAFFAVAGGLVAPADTSVLRGAAVALAAPAGQEEPSELPGDLSRESLLARYAEAVAELNAATTCDAKGNALNRLLAIDRTWLLLGYGEPGLDSVSFYPEVLTFCYEEFFVKCHELQDPAFGSAMLGILRTAHLVVGESLLDASKVDRCLTFELRLEGAFDVRLPGHVWMTHSRSNVPVVSDGLNYTGEAPLESIRFTHTVPAPATVKNTRVEPGVFYVTSMAGDLTYVPGTLISGQALDVKIGVQLMPQFEHWVMTFGPGLDVPLLGAWWSVGFQELHRDEEVVAGSWLIGGFQHVGGSVYARKTYVRSGAGGLTGTTIDEQTSIELWHTPRA